ncbi:MAG: type II toxin-antitoxin system Phd/YefM family antitoxin [Eubacteriaceae bacterium]|nr:type II toxin-antitoxin system Phd/YefM family antitoxin [Eubacteriaceae bacterium]
MIATVAEFKNNIGKYLSLVAEQDIFITKNGKSSAKLSSTKQSKVDIVNSLIGIIPCNGEDLGIKQVKAERLAEKFEGLDWHQHHPRHIDEA